MAAASIALFGSAVCMLVKVTPKIACKTGKWELILPLIVQYANDNDEPLEDQLSLQVPLIAYLMYVLLLLLLYGW